MNLGKQLRLKHFYRHDKYRTVIVPMDHGMTMGPIFGIEKVQNLILTLSKYDIDGIVLHKGMIALCADVLQNVDIPIIMHLSARTQLSSNRKEVLVATVKEAISFGCSAVSVHINFGGKDESEMVRDVAQVSNECYKMGIPLLIMAYAESYNVQTAKHLARISAELGADWVKLLYTEEGGDFRQVVEGSPIPVLIAGGEKSVSNPIFFKNVKSALEAGVGGLAIGRNVFQSIYVDETLGDLMSLVRARST